MRDLSITPPPWSVRRTNDAPVSLEPYWQIVGRPDSRSSSGFGITNVYPLARAGGFPEAEANAHLIAAAPDLYAALADMLMIDGSSGEQITEALRAAQAAMAKARGETQ